MTTSTLSQQVRQTKAITNYLNALATRRRSRRKVDATALEAAIVDLKADIAATTDPLTRLKLIQERNDTQEALRAAPGGELEQAFIEVVAEYSTRKGITFRTWRQMGVAAEVLNAGGLEP